jgi:hypothetical protein
VRGSLAASTLAAALPFVCALARAQDAPAAPMTTLVQRPDVDAVESTIGEPGYFNGLVAPGRPWEVQSDTTFSTSRVFTQRFEVARFVSLHPRNTSTGLVVRTDFGAESDTTSGFYSLQGPLFSVGGRLRSTNNDHWIEFGVRVIPPYPGANDTNPQALRLALGATLASGQADDARWLPFSRWGYQIYGSVQSRVAIDAGTAGRFLLGVRYGGETSLTPLSVPSWLGSQQGIVGNVFLDVFFGAPVIGGQPLALQLGGHAEVSLSSVWPGGAVFPLMGSVFGAWSPATWISVRVFYGLAGVPAGAVPLSRPYGLNLTFDLP